MVDFNGLSVLPQSSAILVVGAFGIFCWLSILAVHRLYLSPVAHIPGPILGKLTYW